MFTKSTEEKQRATTTQGESSVNALELDWKKDSSVLAIQERLRDLDDRERLVADRTTALEQDLEKGKREAIDVRAGIMLGERSQKDLEVLQGSLNKRRDELTALYAESEAVDVARKRLAQDLTKAEDAARARISQALAPMYKASVQRIHDWLQHATEENDKLKSLCAHARRQGLERSFPVRTWNYLTTERGSALRLWFEMVRPVVEPAADGDAKKPDIFE